MRCTYTLSKSLVAPIMASALFFTVTSFEAQAQTVSREATTTGVVVTVLKNSITVKTPDGKYSVFQVDKYTAKPANIAVGSEVRVTWTPSGNPDYQFAEDIIVIPPGQTAEAAQQTNVPVAVQDTQKVIEKNFSKFRLGFQGGFGLSPELADIGMHAQFGPFFTRDVFFRPSFDFGWGQVTTMWALNGDVLFRPPFGPRGARWFYFGGGPGFNFTEQSFGASNINFSNFNYDATLNLVAGMQWRTGMYTEIRTAVFSKQVPVVRFVVGYTF